MASEESAAAEGTDGYITVFFEAVKFPEEDKVFDRLEGEDI